MPPLMQFLRRQAPALEGAEERLCGLFHSTAWLKKQSPGGRSLLASGEQQKRSSGTEGRRSQGHRAASPARPKLWAGYARQRLNLRGEAAVLWVRSSRQKGSALQSLLSARAPPPIWMLLGPLPTHPPRLERASTLSCISCNAEHQLLFMLLGTVYDLFTTPSLSGYRP